MTDTVQTAAPKSTPLVLVPGPGRHDASELARFIRAHATVTSALERWCLLTGLGSAPIEARVHESVVHQVGSAAEPLPNGVTGLELEPGMRIVCRKVALVCGPAVLMEATNWYVPDRLPADIALTLETTSTPFGWAIEALGVQRIEVRDIAAQAGELFAQQAIVCDRGGNRLAFVVERFLPALLARYAA